CCTYRTPPPHSLHSHSSLTPPPPSQLYPLSLHDALPIYAVTVLASRAADADAAATLIANAVDLDHPAVERRPATSLDPDSDLGRSEEHTSELQSRVDLVCRLLLEKKKNKKIHDTRKTHKA